MIDWTKPLELIDGTPVILEPHDPNGIMGNGPNRTPDRDGDYWVVRLDGKKFFNNCDYLCVHANGCGEGTRVPAVRNREQPAYVALTRGFHPWSGGESAPNDWDGGAVLLRNGIVMEAPVTSWRHPWNDQADCGNHDIIGYRKRIERGAVHTDGSR